MAQVTVDTVANPVWWDGAVTVVIQFDDLAEVTFTRSEVELLPEGVSTNSADQKTLTPWWRIRGIRKAS